MTVSVEAISQHAGVARATAYRALTRHPNVSERVRKRVQEAVEALGYPRLRTRNAQQSGRSTFVAWGPLPEGIIGLGSGSSEIYAAMERYLHQDGNVFHGISVPVDTQRNELPLDLFAEDVAGIFTLGFHSDHHLALMGGKWPVAALLSTRRIPRVASLMPDAAGAASMAVERLLKAGHRRIALVNGLPSARNISQLMLEGVTGAMAQAGVAFDPQWHHSHRENQGRLKKTKTMPLGIRAGAELLDLERRKRPTAIVARVESMAGILAAATERKIRIPEELSLVGYGTQLGAMQFHPTLTAVTFDPEEMVRTALTVMKAVPASGVQVTIPVTWMEGDTVCRPS